MEKKAAPNPTARKLACVLTLLFGVFNLFTGALALLGGGLSLLGVWVWLSLALLGVAMLFGGICVLMGRMPARWRTMALVMLALALASLFAAIFYRGIAWSNMLNVVVAFVFLNYAK